MRCKKHPKYKAIRKPRVACPECWAMFLGMDEYCANCGCQAKGF